MPSIAVNEAVHVAVGIVSDRDRYFITRRFPNAHQGGKWEFPGGKIDPGESVLTALRRELHEELGIDVHDANPLMQVRHVYPDKSVLLDVWSITGYTGVPHGREGQEARWASHAEMLTLDFPEADLPIQRRLWLPGLYAISDCHRYGHAAFIQRLEAALRAGLQLIQLREPEMAQAEYVALARNVTTLCHGYGAKVLLNADPTLVVSCGANGVHLNSRRLMQTERRPLTHKYFVAASCHNEEELKCAANIGADAVVIGPVAATASHPKATPLGWERFAQLCQTAVPAVYALGGMRADDIARAREYGAQGVAMISGMWESVDVAGVVAACESTRI